MTRIAAPLGRSVKEWIGSSPDARPPKAVLLRILRRYNHACYLSKREITPGMVYGRDWQAEHIKPLWEGGQNREINLAPVLIDSHKVKSAEEAGRRAKADRQAESAFLRQKPAGANRLQGRGFPKFAKERPKPTKIVPRRPLFTNC